MDLTLTRQELIQVSTTTSRNTLKLLPPGKTKKQKLAVGDDSGVISCFSVKKGEFQSVFKTPPCGAPISALALGGAAIKRDKIYTAQGQKIVAFNKKGKEVFRLNSSLTETISSLRVEGPDIYTAGEFVYNSFRNNEDKDMYMCGDKINAMSIDFITSQSSYNAILGCQDRRLRVLQGSSCVDEIGIESAATALATFQRLELLQDGETTTTTKGIIYGCQNGSVGFQKLRDTKLSREWLLKNKNPTPSPINCLFSYDINLDDLPEILIGRDDGSLEVLYDDLSPKPKTHWKETGAESIRSITAGSFCTAGFEELITCSFSGRVMSYTTEPLHMRDEADEYGRSRGTIQRESRIKMLKKEIGGLAEKVAKEKEKMIKQADSVNFLPTTQQFTVDCKMNLNVDEGCYRISVETPVPIDFIALQANVPLDLLDAGSNQHAILSITRPDRSPGFGKKTALLATLRCQEATTRVEIKARTVEGQYGDLQIIVVGTLTPKTGQIATLNIKPLSLHHRVNDLASPPLHWNSLLITGNFSLAQAHEWMVLCVPDIPTRPGTSEGVEMFFKNAYLGSAMTATYRKGEAKFSSDSITTIAILREVISREATAKKVSISIKHDINEQTISAFLSLVFPRLNAQLELVQQAELIEAIKEIRMQEEDNSWLSNQCKYVSENAEKIKSDLKSQPQILDYFTGVITDLYVDYYKIRGYDVLANIPKLQQVIQQNSLEDIIAFFKKPS